MEVTFRLENYVGDADSEAPPIDNNPGEKAT
jgi:hypothetical protein